MSADHGPPLDNTLEYSWEHVNTAMEGMHGDTLHPFIELATMGVVGKSNRWLRDTTYYIPLHVNTN